MASLYADENFPRAVVEHLRALGHDVLTALDAGQANQGVPDDVVLDFATVRGRAVLTINRADYMRLHRAGGDHAGIIACTEDPLFDRQSQRIHDAIAGHANLSGKLVRVYRGT